MTAALHQGSIYCTTRAVKKHTYYIAAIITALSVLFEYGCLPGAGESCSIVKSGCFKFQPIEVYQNIDQPDEPTSPRISIYQKATYLGRDRVQLVTLPMPAIGSCFYSHVEVTDNLISNYCLLSSYSDHVSRVFGRIGH